eukprot:2197985-Amphidinium_carterae.1
MVACKILADSVKTTSAVYNSEKHERFVRAGKRSQCPQEKRYGFARKWGAFQVARRQSFFAVFAMSSIVNQAPKQRYSRKVGVMKPVANNM